MANHDWYPIYPNAEMNSTFIALGCEAVGFLTQLRHYSWTNGGIPADEVYLKLLAKRYGISAYKFSKIWQKLENFFIEVDKHLFFPEDEAKRQKAVELISKRQWAGRLGAQARWGKKVQPISEEPVLPMAKPMANDGYPELQLHTNRREPPSSPQSPKVDHAPQTQAEGGGIPPRVANATTYEQTPLPLQSAQQTQEVCSQRDIEQIRHKAASLGLAAPSVKLCRRIREKFLPEPIEAVLGFLVRWEEQKTVGLWNAKTAEDFRLEAARQQAGVPRKPSQRDLSDMRLMERAKERDRARGMA